MLILLVDARYAASGWVIGVNVEAMEGTAFSPTSIIRKNVITISLFIFPSPPVTILLF
jgi:hypothetical protein